MTRKSIILLLVIVFSLPALANAVSEKDFEVQTTQNFINLCTTPVEDPLHNHAINFCHGYFAGAYHYYEAISAGRKGFNWYVSPIHHRLEMTRLPCSLNGSTLIRNTWERSPSRPSSGF